MTSLFEKIFGKPRNAVIVGKTSLEAMIGHTVESLSHAYKVDEDTVRKIVHDWMRFERAVKDGTYV